MWKSYVFSIGTPCLPATLLAFVLCRVRVRRDSWGVMWVAARAPHFLREVMSKSRGARRTTWQKEGKRISKTMLLTPQQFSLFGQTVSDPWLNRVEWMPCLLTFSAKIAWPSVLSVFVWLSFCHHCCIFWIPRSGLVCYNLTYLWCCLWEYQQILQCCTSLNFRENKNQIPWGTARTPDFNIAELVSFT